MKGRPILGVIAGFLFGLMLGVTLFFFGVVPLHSDALWILPLVGIVLGLVMAAWAPFGSGEPEATPATPSPSGTTLEQEAIVPDSDGADNDE